MTARTRPAKVASPAVRARARGTHPARGRTQRFILRKHHDRKVRRLPPRRIRQRAQHFLRLIGKRHRQFVRLALIVALHRGNDSHVAKAVFLVHVGDGLFILVPEYFAVPPPTEAEGTGPQEHPVADAVVVEVTIALQIQVDQFAARALADYIAAAGKGQRFFQDAGFRPAR